ncbi:DsbA family protein [Blastococcus mobilis]|uniref:Protein-disulfide isomerase n=1 Tax=Blastococcus mobilis TaxID=1938746 RepID=A0A238W2C3_9ACTN|nr:thioredoxin domain-containing protein [Blastococcus mobilis]SNR40551.1 Protein-disulfide isomerase [Blastococcus mobilis]
MPADPRRGRSKATDRQRAAARRAAEAAARAQAPRHSRTFIGGTVAVLAALVALIILGVRQDQWTADASAAAPANTTADGAAVRIGDPDAPVTLTVYEDFLCPACRSFEDVLGPTLAELVADGTAAAEYRPIAILDHASPDAYPTRALNAAAVVTDTAGPEAFLAFHDLLFAHQPAEGGAGLSDAQLIALAERAGATGPQVEAGIRERAFQDWTRRVTDNAGRDGVTSTPTILINGEPLAERTPQGLQDAVRAAAAA